jgi:hypothetical protein
MISPPHTALIVPFAQCTPILLPSLVITLAYQAIFRLPIVVGSLSTFRLYPSKC